MNTVARAASSSSSIRQIEKKGMLSLLKYRLGFSVVTLSLLFSALGIVYIKDLHRRLLIEYHQLQQAKDQSVLRLERLLFEYSRLSTQPTLEKVSKTKLGMHVASPKDIVLLETHGPVISQK